MSGEITVEYLQNKLKENKEKGLVVHEKMKKVIHEANRVEEERQMILEWIKEIDDK